MVSYKNEVYFIAKTLKKDNTFDKRRVSVYNYFTTSTLQSKEISVESSILKVKNTKIAREGIYINYCLNLFRNYID